MRKIITNKVVLDEAINVLLSEIKADRFYINFRYAEAGFISFSFLERRTKRQTTDIAFCALYLFCCEKKVLRTSHFEFSIENDNPNAFNYEDALACALIIKNKIGDMKRVPWRTVAQEIGFVADSGVLARSMRSRASSPIDMIYTIMKFCEIRNISARHGGLSISISILK